MSVVASPLKSLVNDGTVVPMFSSVRASRAAGIGSNITSNELGE